MTRRAAAALLPALALAAGPPVPKYGPGATPLSRDHAWFQSPRHPAPDFWALAPFYVPQLNDYSCSVASVAAVVNALTRAGRPLADSDRHATHASLLASVQAARWPERMRKEGADGQVGVTLDQLAEVVTEALRKQGVAAPLVERFPVEADDAATRARWRRALEANEASAEDLILVHFAQDTLTGAAGGPYPHVSPVGAFDAGTGRALVMDVDREWYEPYWVPAALVVRAMAVRTPAFGTGGWLRVRARP